MNEDPLQYNISNKITRRDATLVLNEYGPKLTWNKSNSRVIDIGCADGSVTEILERYIPKKYEILIGCDISNAMVQFATEHYSSERKKFIQLDIMAELPVELKESFGHVFCLYVFHWVKEHEKGFKNIYNLLVNGGECLISFLGNSPIYRVFIALSKTEKWRPYLEDVNDMVSLYHDYQSPEITIYEQMKKVGFSYIDVKCKQTVYIYEDEKELKNIMSAISPFKFPTGKMHEDFMNAYVEMAKEMKYMDETTKSFNYNYNIFKRLGMSLASVNSDAPVKDDSSMDTLGVKILNLRTIDEESKYFAIKVTFFDQLILSSVLKSIGAREHVKVRRVMANGMMTYDPGDYEKMCLFGNYPLVVNIQLLSSAESTCSSSLSSNSLRQNFSLVSSIKSDCFMKSATDVSCCNVDILPLFLNENKMYIKKRMQPVYEVPLLERKSWDNLPLLTMELSIIQNKANVYHHKLFKEANFFRINLLGAYNMIIPHDNNYTYTAASKIPMHNDSNTSLVVFNNGSQVPKRFIWNNFYPKWESLRLESDNFTLSDEKFICNFRELLNEENIDLAHYFSKEASYHTTVWCSFHRSILLENTERWLWNHLRRNLWPFEIHIYEERGGYSFMAFLNLSRLLYPGENIVRLAVPLQWMSPEIMLEMCGCESLLTSNDKVSSTPASTQKPSKIATDSAPTSTSNDIRIVRPTGMDDTTAFIIVEVKLARPLKQITIPQHIHEADLANMLKELEQENHKRECTGRGQLERDWQSTVNTAANLLRRVPYYGMIDINTLIRQLSGTRTHVEVATSCWQDAAVYVNNNFVVGEYLKSDDIFEEMLMIAHACLMRVTCNTLVNGGSWQNLNSTLHAARSARQMQDTSHAIDLYMKLAVENPRSANIWRELSICLKEVDCNWANVCLNKSFVLNPRDPMTLLCKGCAVFEEDKCAAEPFFMALLALNPFWSTAWVVASVYYMDRELFYMSDQIMEYKKKTEAEGLVGNLEYSRAWSHELGDWWDHTPLLPGINAYYDAADILLRIRSISLAELCVARGLSETGESAIYFHLLALCCRLRGNIADALCHIELGLKKYSEISYLRTLEAECYYKQNKIQESIGSFRKCGNIVSAYNILLSLSSREPQHARSVLVDLVQCQPSAYTWIALADDWIMKAAMSDVGDDTEVLEEQEAIKSCAIACAVQALKYDRMAGRAWAMLSQLVKTSARRLHCIDMANLCGFNLSLPQNESKSASKQTVCHRLGVALGECQCNWCHDFKL